MTTLDAACDDPQTNPKAVGQAASRDQATPIAFARGDGIGPEIMDATLQALNAAGARLDLREVRIGQSVYEQGITSGIEPEAWDVLRSTRVFLKSPITTPQGKGWKSLNVTCRKALGLYANVRPCKAYSPFVRTRHPDLDVVIVRENEEDTYAGIEHRQTREVTQCLKLITRPGSEKIVRYAFEYARKQQRRKVTCLIKDNIMKVTDGLFRHVFEEIGQEYPEIEQDSLIIDIGAARLADSPERFDVIVTPNLYGDIVSDIAAQITGSVGLAPSANIGRSCAMFEAIHGSAPDIAGQGVANPSGLMLAAVQMLLHIGQRQAAQTLHNGWLCALEAGLHTADIYDPNRSHRPVGTQEFAQAVIDRMGERPQTLAPADYPPLSDESPADERHPEPAAATRPREQKALVGVDVFLDWEESGRDPDTLGKKLEQTAAGSGLKLKMITNRGVKVYPQGMPETFCTDHWRCRFVAEQAGEAVSHGEVIALLQRVAEANLDFIKTEHLYTFDGELGYTLGQGE